MISRRSIRFAGMAAILAVAAISFICAPPVKAVAAEKKTPKWIWTKERPKPVWFDWGEKYSKDKPVRGGVLRIASGRYIGMMNPNHWPVNDWATIIKFYEGRMAYDGTYRQRRPWLVSSYKFLSPTVVDETFKQGVYFTDGTEMNAEGVLYLFNWIKDKKNGTWSRGTTKMFKKVEVVGEYTLRYTTKKPWGNYPAGWFGFIISAKALRGDVLLREIKTTEKSLKKTNKKLAKLEKKSTKTEKDTAKIAKLKKEVAKLTGNIAKWKEESAGHINTDLMPVGTGAYMLEKASSGNFIKMKRNPNWWFGQSIGRPDMPYFDGIINTVIPDSAIRLANLRAGKIDQMVVSKSQYDMIKNDPDLNIHAYLVNTTVQLIMNHKSKALSDMRVRKAISHAIDRKALIAGTEFGLAREASCIYPADHWAHNPALQPVKYDPELARRLLKEAGYGDGLSLRGFTGANEASISRAEAVKNMLAKVGIKWKVDSLSPAAIDDRMKNLEYDVSFGVLALIQDPSSVVENFYKASGRFNFGRYDDPAVTKMVFDAKEETVEDERKKIYFALEEKVYGDYTDAWLWWEMSVSARHKRLQGYNPEWWVQGQSHYLYSHPMWFKGGKR
ncbi:MAG: hypothetical protein JRD68_05905 [Deltaproteobacteria bacterium]|nr:hypothetical protein [Deltaproteobacteria bacterium]